MSKPSCPENSAHGVVMVRQAAGEREYWFCISCSKDIEPVADDDSARLAKILFELADDLEHGEVKVDAHVAHPDETAHVVHHTYVVGGGLDRIEVRLREAEEQS